MPARVLLSLLFFTACSGEPSRAPRPPRPLYLTSGDSLVILATGPIVVPNGLRGLLVRFYPYSGLADTNRLRGEAIELLGILRRELDSVGVPWVALQATNQSPGPKAGFFQVENYGFVVERHADGLWYLQGDAKPIPLTP